MTPNFGLSLVFATVLVYSVLTQTYEGYQNYNPPPITAAQGSQYPQYQYQGNAQYPQMQYQGQNQPYQQSQGYQYPHNQPQYQAPLGPYQPAQIQLFPPGSPPYQQNQNEEYQLSSSQYQGQQDLPDSWQYQYQPTRQNLTTHYSVSQLNSTDLTNQASTNSSTSSQDDNQAKDCSAPRVRGEFCSSSQQRQMFYFNPTQKVCQPFMYNGCNGNGNRFETADECKEFCVNGNGTDPQLRDDASADERAAMKSACEAEYDTDHLTPQQCNNNQTCSEGYQCNNEFCCPTSSYLCALRYDSGKFSEGGEKSDRYFYTSQYKTCMRFSYYGTLGNENNFPDYNSCMRTCGSQS